MRDIRQKEYITKGKTSYKHIKEFNENNLVEEYWTRNNIRIDSAGYMVTSDIAELINAYKAMIPSEGADITAGVGEIMNRDNLIRLIDDFKYEGNHELGGKIVFLESPTSNGLKVSSPIEDIIG